MRLLGLLQIPHVSLQYSSSSWTVSLLNSTTSTSLEKIIKLTVNQLSKIHLTKTQLHTLLKKTMCQITPQAIQSLIKKVQKNLPLIRYLTNLYQMFTAETLI